MSDNEDPFAEPVQVLKIKRVSGSDSKPPSYSRDGDGALDLYADLYSCGQTVKPWTRASIRTGWAFELPPGHVGLICPRSGLQFVDGVVGGIGVIDENYRGEVKAMLWNFTDAPYTVSPNDRVAQMLVVPVTRVEVMEVDELSPDATRGVAGFGSTGR